MKPTQPQQVHRLPRARSVDRVRFLESLANGKRVVHCGFWGTEGIRESSPIWLHSRLAEVSSHLIGLDINRQGVEHAAAQGLEVYEVNCSDPDAVARLNIPRADVVIAGELIEHLDSPGSLLEAMHHLVATQGALVLTTPNAYAVSNVLAALFHREVINPDHVALYSWYTLTEVLRRHRWNVTWFGVYPYPRSSTLAGKLVFGSQTLLSRLSPFVNQGLIAISRPAQR